MNKLRNFSQSNWLPMLVVLIGLASRLLAATRGHNCDMDSWFIVADIAHHGGNVYADTTHYNYGPIWFTILHGLDVLARHNQNVFRYFIAGLLSLADVGIYLFLRGRFGGLVAALFFLNPVSIIITGYHCQFDNLAIGLGLVAISLVGDGFDKPVRGRKFWGLVVLGISLATKHVLFAFPCWLAVKQKGLLQKLWTILTPLSVFALSFVPYWFKGGRGIIQNVFLFRALPADYLYYMFVPPGVQNVFGSLTVWLFLLVLFAFIYRQRNTVESLLFYTGVLVAASPATLNEYLAIPVAFVATHLNLFTILYTAIATVYLAVDANGLHLISLSQTTRVGFSIYSLCYALYTLGLGLVWVTWPRNIMSFIERCAFEVNNQLGLEK